MVPVLIPILAFPASALLARASHMHVTPRGGGLAIVVSVLTGLGALALVFPGQAMAWGTIAGAGLVVAAVGLLDDLRNASPKVKFPVQILAAGLLMVGLLGVLRDTPDYKRFKRAGRLNESARYRGDSGIFSQTLSFVPLIDPQEILDRHRSIVATVNSPAPFFERCLTSFRHLRERPPTR